MTIQYHSLCYWNKRMGKKMYLHYCGEKKAELYKDNIERNKEKNLYVFVKYSFEHILF